MSPIFVIGILVVLLLLLLSRGRKTRRDLEVVPQLERARTTEGERRS
jgi:hypothetical protein